MSCWPSSRLWSGCPFVVLGTGKPVRGAMNTRAMGMQGGASVKQSSARPEANDPHHRHPPTEGNMSDRIKFGMWELLIEAILVLAYVIYNTSAAKKNQTLCPLILETYAKRYNKFCASWRPR